MEVDTVLSLFKDLKASRQNTFVVHGTAADLIALSVPDVRIQRKHTLAFPIRKRDVRFLIHRNLATTAPFGRGEHTLVDETVRKTLEIPASMLQFHHPSFKLAIEEVTKRACKMMSVQVPVEAKLHKMLIYRPGDFFQTHRDAIHHENQFATLVIQLPSIYTGGKLEVEHVDDSQSIDLSKPDYAPRWVAFYSDCKHRVLPILSGYRCCLTYDLCFASDICHSPPPLLRFTSSTSAVIPVEDELIKEFKKWTLQSTHPTHLVLILEHLYPKSDCLVDDVFQRMDVFKGMDQVMIQTMWRIIQHCPTLECRFGILTDMPVNRHRMRSADEGGDDSTDEEDNDDRESLESSYDVVGEDGERREVFFTQLTSLGMNIHVSELLDTTEHHHDHVLYTNREDTGNSGVTGEAVYQSCGLIVYPRELRYKFVQIQELGRLDHGLSVPELKQMAAERIDTVDDVVILGGLLGWDELFKDEAVKLHSLCLPRIWRVLNTIDNLSLDPLIDYAMGTPTIIGSYHRFQELAFVLHDRKDSVRFYHLCSTASFEHLIRLSKSWTRQFKDIVFRETDVLKRFEQWMEQRPTSWSPGKNSERVMHFMSTYKDPRLFSFISRDNRVIDLFHLYCHTDKPLAKQIDRVYKLTQHWYFDTCMLMLGAFTLNRSKRLQTLPGDVFPLLFRCLLPNH